MSDSWQTDDMLLFLDDPGMHGLLDDDSAPVHWGLDFGTLEISLLHGNALPMISHWLLGLHERIQHHKLALLPYFDSGLNSAFEALDQTCTAQPSNCNPMQQALVALPFASEGPSFPPRDKDPRSRFRVFNAAYTKFDEICQRNFTDDDRVQFPYLFWEPSSQWDMLLMAQNWTECNSLPPWKRSVNDNLTIVSNQGPEMLEVFASSQIHRGADVVWLDGSDNATHAWIEPQSVVVVGDSPVANAPADSRQWLLTSVWDTSSDSSLLLVGKLYNDTAPRGHSSPAILSLDATPLARHRVVSLSLWDGPWMWAPSLTQSNSYSAAPLLRGNVSDDPLLLLASSDGSYAIGPVDRHTGRVTRWLVTGVLSVLPTHARLADAHLLCGPAPSSIAGCGIVVVSTDASTGVWITVTDAASGSRRLQETSFPFAIASPTAGVSVAPASLAQSGNEWTFRGLVLFTSSSEPLAGGSNSTRPRLYGGTLEVRGNATAPVWSGLALHTTASPRRLGFGSAPRIQTRPATSTNATLVTMVIHRDGSCQGGYWMNNGDTPHCAIPYPSSDDDFFMFGYQAVDGLLTYHWGALDRWESLVTTHPASSPAQPSSYLSICHPSIFSGKVETGTSASVALFPRRVSYTSPKAQPPGTGLASQEVREELAPLVIHDGRVTPPIETVVVCGWPVYKDGIVATAWHLVPSTVLP